MDEKLQDIIAKLKENNELIDGKFAVLNDLVSKFQGQEARVKHLEGVLQSRGVSIPGLEDEKKEFFITRLINAQLTGDWSQAGFEKEVMDEVKKVMGTTTGPAGGFLVPVQAIPGLIEMLRARAVVIQAGATVLEGLEGGRIDFMKQTGGAIAYWVAEGVPITPSELATGMLTMTPKAIAALVKINNQLIKRSNPSVEAMVRRDIAQALALAIDLAALRGTGVETQPLGIANTPNIGTFPIGTDGGDFLFEHIVEMEGVLEDANALFGALGIITRGAVKRKLKKMRIPQWNGDLGGQYVMLPMTDAVLRDHMGYDMLTTTQLPTDLVKGTSEDCTEVYFGNWEELLLGNWGGMEIMASQETSDAFEKNQTWIRIIQEVDAGLRHTASFCLCSDARTT